MFFLLLFTAIVLYLAYQGHWYYSRSLSPLMWVRHQFGGDGSSEEVDDQGLLTSIHRSDQKGNQLALVRRFVHRGPINYNWGTGPILGTGIRNMIVVNFRGHITVPESGRWQFRTQADDGVKLEVDGKGLINQWRLQAPTMAISRPLTLDSGKDYPIGLRWFENSGGAVLRLFWKKEGDAKWSIVPGKAYRHVPRKHALRKHVPRAGAEQEQVLRKAKKAVDKTVTNVKNHATVLTKIQEKLNKYGNLSQMDQKIIDGINKRITVSERKINENINALRTQQRNIELKLVKAAELMEHASKMSTMAKVHGGPGPAPGMGQDRLAFVKGVLSSHERRLNGMETKLFSIKSILSEMKMGLRDISLRITE